MLLAIAHDAVGIVLVHQLEDEVGGDVAEREGQVGLGLAVLDAVLGGLRQHAVGEGAANRLLFLVLVQADATEVEDDIWGHLEYVGLGCPGSLELGGLFRFAKSLMNFLEPLRKGLGKGFFSHGSALKDLGRP